MSHIDERFKDAAPQDTVDNIIRLLAKHGIVAQEDWRDSGIENCYSVAVSIENSSFTSYGKGVSKELARASGYAELIERLQSGYLSINPLTYSDAQKMTRAQLLQHSRALFEAMCSSISKNEQVDFPVDKLLDTCFAYRNEETTDVIPYLNANDGSPVYVPVNLVPRLYTSSGLAAGNSKEEAIVQGFSEVVERYCHCRILREHITPPNIPHSFLKQFSTAYGIICALEQAGYTVLIKDCSLKEGFPVVASVIIDKKRHGYRINVGASPVFEIALERCLTEIMQGRSVNTLSMITDFMPPQSRTAHAITYALVHGDGRYPLDFFEGEPAYSFEPFPDRSKATNIELLSYIMEYLQQHHRTMLLRDLSHFGFPTFRIIVPGMSEVFTFSFVGEPSLLRMGYETKDIITNPKIATPEQLFLYSVLYRVTPSGSSGPLTLTTHTRLPMKLSRSSNRFLGLMGAAYVDWELGNLNQCLKHVSSAFSYVSEDQKDILSCLHQYVLQRSYKTSEADILKQLRTFYPQDIMQTFTQMVKDNANPFATLFPICDRNCVSCQWSNLCTMDKNQLVIERMNVAAACFDSQTAFVTLQALFANL